MKKIMSVLTVLCFAFTAYAQQALSEAQIAKMMKEANEAEVDAAKLAKKNAQNEQVKAYAQKMLDEHKANEKEIKKLARKKDIGMDKSEDMKQMKEDSKMTMNNLKNVEKSAFDKTYISSQLQMHQQVLDNINNKFLPAATTPELKSYLERTKERVENHLNEARSLQTVL